MGAQGAPHERVIDRQDADILASLDRRWAAGEISDAVYLKRLALVLSGIPSPVLGPQRRRRPWDPPATEAQAVSSAR